MKLDKHWTYEKDTWCPHCGKKGLWYDNHDDKEANWYCEKCDDGLTIVGECFVRGGVKE